MKKRIQVVDNASLERDQFSGAILNCNFDAYNSAISRKKQLIENQKTISELKSQVEDLLNWKNEIINILKSNDINSNNG